LSYTRAGGDMQRIAALGNGGPGAPGGPFRPSWTDRPRLQRRAGDQPARS